MAFGRVANHALVRLIRLERRIDPYFRPEFDRLLQRPLASVVQALIRAHRASGAAAIATEQLLPDEDNIAAAIADTMSAFLHRTYDHAGPAQRAGNTKTYGVVRAQFEVLPDLALHLRRGLFVEPAVFPAWVRFAGPGPLAPPDMQDNGVLSIGIKLMGVPGAKLLDDERWTQDFTGISAPTFTTPNVVENLKLQHHISAGTPVLYFLAPTDHHFLDGIMQGLFAKTQVNPLGERYWSCSSYLLGDDQAMHYSLKPRQRLQTRFPRRPSNDYLREAMAATLRARGVEFDFLVQLQTDVRLMPIEDDGIEWPERCSPFVKVGVLRLPRQCFNSPAQLAFADSLSFNPWHSLEAHRPLGNQNRARKTIYQRLSQVRQTMNDTTSIEPVGDERFDYDRMPIPAHSGGLMTDTRERAARTLGAIRLVVGGGALFAPRKMARIWGIDPAVHPQVLYIMRLFGVRTVLLGLQLLGEDEEDKLERALRVGILIHASDTTAALLAGLTGEIPKRSAITGALISAINTTVALYGSGLVGHEAGDA